MAATLWRVRSVGEVGEGSAGAQMREGERASEALGSSGRGEVVASSTRDVGVESAARTARGGGYAEKEELTAGARGQREREESGRGRGEGSRADGRARQGRERRGEGRRARGDGPDGPKGRGGGESGLLFPFSFILAFVFPFLFIYSI
jgi:hypothetical protein